MGFHLFPTMGFKPRSGKVDHYPFDLDGSERITRLATGTWVWNDPWNGNNYAKLGSMSPLLPQMDAAVWGIAWGKDGYGPIQSALPLNLNWQITVPGLNKQLPNQ
jgi:hypothetical protein